MPAYPPPVAPAQGAGAPGPDQGYASGQQGQAAPGHPGQQPQQPQQPQAPGRPGAAPSSPASGEWPPPPPVTPSYADTATASYGDSGGGAGWGSSYEQSQPRPGGRRGGGIVVAVLVAALVAGGVGGGIGYWAAEHSDNSSNSTTVSASGPADVKRAPGSVAGIAARSLGSVVTIDAQSGNGDGGTGTGFVYDKQGHILTNNHVVAAAAGGGSLSATFANGKKYTAEVVGRAQGYDVAVIKLKNAPSNLKPLPLGDSEKVAVGDATIAIGSPFGLNNTVTTGILSAKDRPVTTSESGNTNDASYMSALQTDASINPGNSGGPLLDGRGAVIGINSAIRPSSDGGGMGGGGQGGSIGLGFAIPINQAKNVAQQLIKTGQPVYPVIGASVSLDDQSQGDGAVLSDQGPDGSQPVTPGGPADKAGLKPRDVITRFDNSVIDSGPTLIGEIWNHQPGDTVKVTYKRGGQEHTVNLTLGERKGDSSS